MSYSKQARGSLESISRRIPEGIKVYLPVLPVMTLVGLFILYPIAQAIYSSLFNKDLFMPSEVESIGLANYAEIRSNPTIHQVLWNMLIWVVIGSLTAIVLGLLTGRLLHEKLPYTSVASAIVLILRVPPRVIGVSTWQFMFGGPQGITNELPVQLGVTDEYIVMFGSTELSLWPPIIGMIWRFAPLFALLTPTSLQGIDEYLYEAVRMGGAAPWEQFQFITIPMMRYNFAIGLLLMPICSIRNFPMVWVMTKGGPGVSSSTLPVMICRTAFVDSDAGLVPTLLLILFVVLFVFSYHYIQVYDQVRGDV